MVVSEARRAEFAVRGELYLLVREWALPAGGLAGYARVEPERAAELLASLPGALARQPGLGALLAGARGVGASPSQTRPRARGLVLFRRVPIAAQAEAPAEEAAPVVPVWKPEEPPMLEPVIELAAQAAIASTLIAAAANGAPFCEMCGNCQ